MAHIPIWTRARASRFLVTLALTALTLVGCQPQSEPPLVAEAGFICMSGGPILATGFGVLHTTPTTGSAKITGIELVNPRDVRLEGAYVTPDYDFGSVSGNTLDQLQRAASTINGWKSRQPLVGALIVSTDAPLYPILVLVPTTPGAVGSIDGATLTVEQDGRAWKVAQMIRVVAKNGVKGATGCPLRESFTPTPMEAQAA